MPDPENYKEGKRKIRVKKGAHVDRVRHSKLKMNPKLENGPAANRTCTDICCCVIFIAFIIGYIGIFVYGVINGDPWKLVTPFDTDGNGCGHTDGYGNYKYIYFWKLTDPFAYANGDYYKQTFCIDECPEYKDAPKTSVKDAKTFKELSIACKDTTKSKEEDGCEEQKAIPSAIWFTTFCLPSYAWMKEYREEFEEALKGVFEKFESIDEVRGWVNDVRITWWIILICFGFTLVVSFLYMYFLRWCTDILTWAIVISFQLIIVALGGAFYYYAGIKEEEYADAENATGADLESKSTFYTKTLRYTGYIFWFIGAIYFCVICCICHKIRLVTAIIESTARYVQDNFLVFLVPIVNMLAALFFMLIWLVGTVYLYSVGEAVKRDDYPIANIKWSTETRYMWYINMFAILWIVAFFVCSGDFIIGASACIWYFNQPIDNKKKKNNDKNGEQKKEEKKVVKSVSPLYTAYCWLYTYHLGSIALGSFMLAVVWAIRLIMAYIHAKLKETGATKNKLVEYLMQVIQWFLYCFERFIRFVNKQAFIYVLINA